MLVPDVLATAVPDVITLDAIALTTAPDIVGTDNVAPVNGLDNPVLSIVLSGMVYPYANTATEQIAGSAGTLLALFPVMNLK